MNSMLNDLKRKYLNNLILNDLLDGEDFGDISREVIDRLKKYTFTKGINERLGWEQYTRNLRKILKYQYENNESDYKLLITISHILSEYVNNKSEEFGIDYCIINYLIFGEKYGYDIIQKDNEFFELKNKDREVNRDYRRIVYQLSLYSSGDTEDSTNDYISFMRDIFDRIGYDEGYNFQKLITKNSKNFKGFSFSIVFLLNEKGYELTLEQKRDLYNPWNLSYCYHPLNNNKLELSEINEIFLTYKENYLKISKYSEKFTLFMFDSFYYHILKYNRQPKKVIDNYLNEFKIKYSDIGSLIVNDAIIGGYDEKELMLMKNQFLYSDLIHSRTQVEELFEELDLSDLRKLYEYFHKKVHTTYWYKYGVNENDKNSNYYQRYVIFELSRLFLHLKIKKEHFNWLNSIYEYATGNPRVAILYNLTVGKFSFAFSKIGTEYFLQGYGILLKQLFKNTWLGTIGKNLDEFKKLGKVVLNENYTEDENEIIDIKELQDDIYTKEYAFDTLKKYKTKESDYEIILGELGYNIKTGFILKDTYKSFNEYLFNRINEGEDIFLEKDLIRNILIYNTLAEYCRKYVLFKVDDDLYIPLKKLEKEGLNTEYLEDFFNNIKNEFGEMDFFSVKNIRERINTKILDSFGFGDNFLENIIFYNDEIGRVKIGSHKIFSFIHKKPTIIDFIEEKMKDYKRISVRDFSEKTSEEYGLDINYNKIIVNLSKLENVYYAKNLDTLYLNKQDFINEVYGDDGN